MLFVSCEEAAKTAETAEDTAKVVAEEVSDAVEAVDVWAMTYEPAAIADPAPEAEASADAVVYPVDTESSKVSWRGKKLAYDHYGELKLSEGELHVVEGSLVGGSFTIDMNSLTDVDLAGEPGKQAKLEAHLKGSDAEKGADDFFNTEMYPTATLVITSIEPAEGVEGASHMISGNMTVKATTKQVTFPANVSMSENGVDAKAAFSFDRTVFSVNFNSGTVIEDMAKDAIIADDIDLYIDLKASAPATASAE